MMDKMKKDSGITLMALIITVIIMAIIASISIYEGRKIIKTSRIQTKETNMLAIEVKAKAFAEEIESKTWTEKDETKKDEARNTEFNERGMEATEVSEEALSQVSNEITTEYAAYLVTADALNKMGLSGVEDSKYIVIFSKNDYKLMDIIYIDGIEYNNKKIYTLSNLKPELESE